MAQFRTLIRTDLDRTVAQYRFDGKMFTQDNKANRIDVALYKNKVEVAAEGTVVGIAKRNDNKAIAFPGGIENGRPYIELPEAAYDVEGPLSILIRLTDGEEKTVIGVCDAYVTKTADTDYVTSGHIIVSIQEMTDKLDELEPLLTRLEALNIENAEAVADMVEDTQTALNTVNDIIDNSFMAYVEDDTLVIEPVDPTVTAWATVGQPTDEQVENAVTDWMDSHFRGMQSIQVSGTTPTISGVDNTQYICGEVATLGITLPASGCIDVIFESGSTPTVLTVTAQSGQTMHWPEWFDATSLEANTRYEINIDNTYGVVATWA